MTYRLSIQRSAADDIVTARDWYNEQSDGVGEAFLRRVEQILCQIETGPLLFPVKIEDVRKASVNGYPYSVFFRVREEMVRVIAVLHHSRGPGLVAHRLNK